MSHTMSVMQGVLGMVDNSIDRDAESAAGFSVGSAPPNGFYISPADHLLTQPLGGECVRIDFAHSYAIRIEPVG
jgi:hypothetical protein